MAKSHTPLGLSMPELPEVETTRRGLLPHVVGRHVHGVVVRNASLRWPVTRGLERKLRDRKILDIRRRGKYLLFDIGGGRPPGGPRLAGGPPPGPRGPPPRQHDPVRTPAPRPRPPAHPAPPPLAPGGRRDGP